MAETKDQRLETSEIGVAGMTCDNCARRVDKALRRVAGVKDVIVNRAMNRATVTFDKTQTDVPALHKVVQESGYQPTGLPGQSN